jgi:alkaline phosphatase
MRKKITLVLAMMLLVLTASAKKGPKYVFYFIGDGMGTNQVMGVQYYLQDIEGKYGFKPLCFTQFPYSGLVVTYSANSDVTDSSAAGTALASGEKTDNNVLGLLPDKETPVVTIAEMAHKKGIPVAIGTSCSVDHATPGSFYGHTRHRNMYHQIGTQLSESGFEFFGGAQFRSPMTRDDSDEGNYVQAEKAGYTVVRGYDEYKEKAKSTDKIILFDKEPKSENALAYAIDQKEGDLKLAEITEAAIDYLTMKNPKKGFFMMMEGGRIDNACHANDPGAYIQEMLDFDEAIKVAYDFYLKHKKETLIVITADHETGALGLTAGDYKTNLKVLQYQKMSKTAFSEHLKKMGLEIGDILTWDEVQQELKENFGFWDTVELTDKQTDRLRSVYVETFGMGPGELKEGEYFEVEKLTDEAARIMTEAAQISWAAGCHSGSYVPVFAIGAGAELFTGQMDNTEIPMKIKKLAGY